MPLCFVRCEDGAVPVPTFVTHYYLPGRRPFLNLSDLDQADQVSVLAEMDALRRSRQQHRPFGKRYMELRQLTEARLHDLFVAAGGQPERTAPHYFVLGASDWYQRLADDMNSISLPLSSLPADQASITYPDSFTAMGFGPRFGLAQETRPYHGKVYRLDELEALVSTLGVPAPAWDDSHEAWTRWPADAYIEVQVWADSPIRSCL